jgi:DNA-directed RNA polymerase subunit RPC12/RpoP
MTTMESTTILLNILCEGGASNVLISQVFAALYRAILPQPNTLPDSEYEASDILRWLGLSFQSIHACPNGCVLFRGTYKDAMICPHCSSMQMVKHRNSMVPVKVLRYFPIVPRLKQMF